jgi:putative peptide zinc metalloprotease protein
MKTETPASDLERRKKVRLRIRPDLDIAPQKYEGRTYYVVKDPVSLRYYRFKEQEHFLIKLMDGTHTLDDAQKDFETRFRPERLTLEDLEGFGQQLLNAGLAQNESPQAGKQLFDRRKKRRRTEWIQTFTNILYIKIPVFDPEKLLTKMLPWLRWMFSIWFLTVSVAFMLAAVLLVLTHFQTFLDRLPSFHEFFSFKTVIYLWIALGAVKIIHEFGHGLSCKAFGGEVHEMGLLFLCLSPCMYCNVSDAWTLPSKWKRIIISGAGIYVELMIAAAATFVWWNTPSYPFVNNLSLSLMIVCSVSTVVFNGNPLMRYDGYYVLADWLEIPNLRERCNRYLSRLVMEHCLGIEVQPEPYMALWRRVLFLTYAIVSYVYRWVITFVILRFMATFLKPYKLEVISSMLALLAAGSMVGWPLYRLGKNIHKRGRLPDMKSWRVLVSSAVVAAVVLAFFVVPLPVSRVRQTGLIEIHPDHFAYVYVELPGLLEKIHVREGQTVKRDAVLAEFVNLELRAKEEEARTEAQIKTNLVQAYKARMSETRDMSERLQLARLLGTYEVEKAQAERRLQDIRNEQKNRLVLKAPRDGVVMGLPRIDEIGKLWEQNQGTPFCTVGDPSKLRILVPLAPDDYDLVRDDVKRLRRKNEDVPVTIRVHGREGQTWSGRVSPQLPESPSKTIPVALSNKGGGFLALKPYSEARVEVWKQLQREGGGASTTRVSLNDLEPQSQVYLVAIDFETTDMAICPHTLGQVKIHCQYRTCAWWTWRAISAAFDLGLM